MGDGDDSDARGLLGTIRALTERITDQPLLFGLALALIVVFLISLLVPGLDVGGRLVIGITAVTAVVLLGVLSFNALRQHTVSDGGARAPAAVTAESPSESSHELLLGPDGRLLGGDELTVATDLVLALLDLPAAQRFVHVRSTVLEDESHRRRRPDDYVPLRHAIRSYERSLNRLLRGSVHYFLRWEPSHLIGALLELRSIALRGQSGRESWFVWPAGDPARTVPVHLEKASADFLRSGVYRFDDNSMPIIGMPPDEPVWLAFMFPNVVWTRVVPAVLAHGEWDRGDPVVVDISDWVLSDRPGAELARTRPSEKLDGRIRDDWTW